MCVYWFSFVIIERNLNKIEKYRKIISQMFHFRWFINGLACILFSQLHEGKYTNILGLLT